MGCTKLIMQRNNLYLLFDLEYVEIEGVYLNHIHYQQFHKYTLLVYLNRTGGITTELQSYKFGQEETKYCSSCEAICLTLITKPFYQQSYVLVMLKNCSMF